MSSEEFKVGHEVHDRVPWPSDDTKRACIKLSPSVIQFLTHNEPTTPQEADEIKMLRLEVGNSYIVNKQEKHAVQDEIRRTQDHLENLRKKLETISNARKELDKQTFVYDTILSPFRRLPYDILYRIIQECIAAAGTAKRRCSLPQELLRVSRSFRNVIQTTPTLWNNIYVLCRKELWSRSVSGSISSNMHRINLYSKLSCELPISLEIEEEDDFLESMAGELSTSTTAGSHTVAWALSLWAHRHRLTKLSITMSNSSFFIPSLTSTLEEQNPSVPNLRTMLLRQEEIFIAPEAPSINAFLRWLPQLRHLVLDLNFEQSPFIRCLQDAHNTQGWSNLTTLQLQSDITSFQLVLFLRCCPNLKAALFQMDTRQDDEPPQTTLTHHRLSELIITRTCYNENSSLFSGLRLPALVSLKVHLIEVGSREWLPIIQDVNILFPAVQRLDLINQTRTGPRRLFVFLASVPLTTHLTLSLRPNTTPQLAWFLEKPNESTGQKYFLPHLRQLILRLYLSREEWANPDGLMNALRTLFDVHRIQAHATPNTLEDAFNMSIQVMPFNREKSSISQMKQFLTNLQSEFQAHGNSLEVALEHTSPEESHQYSSNKDIEKRFFDLE
ncbi:hypothetical protein BJ165DRAFT_1404659 [Panaeolus papilionaceus]|nr:hypothetical protein BJ165DRAFT_1404659 [Panaeolus papilionaceus]